MKRYDAARRSMALGMAVMMGVGGITGCGQRGRPNRQQRLQKK